MFKQVQVHGFLMLFWVSVFVLVSLFVINWLTGSKGTYVNHTDMIWDLLGKSVNGTKPKQKSFESKGEQECRRAVERITGKPFPKARPSFLRNGVSGQNLELDCFNSDLRIAVEYNGEQHYKYIPFFHASKDAFYNIKYRDEMKQRLCDQNNVHLITVPYTVPIKEIESYIRNRIKDF